LEENIDFDDVSGKYIPGVCNIGAAEIAGRRKATYYALILLVVIVVLMLVFKTAPGWRLLVFIPAASFGVSAQQLLFKFCVNFKKDRAKAWQMIITGILFGAAIALIFYFI